MALNPDRTPSQPSKGPRCSVCTALHVMDEGDRATLGKWLEDPLLTSTQMIEWLRADGVDYIAESAVRRHRQRKCDEARRVAV